MTISVIIPTLNEAAYIEATLASVLEQSEDVEVIVVDGGSEDETVALASRYVRVMEVPRGRAYQMNAGAKAASGEVLVFLHGDTQLPQNGLEAIKMGLSDRYAVGGCFRTAFDDGGFWMSVWTWRLWMRSPLLAFGDRAHFVWRNTFEAIGGFPDQPLFEDLELVSRIRSEGRFVFLNEAVQTSARRFHRHGAFRQQLYNTALWFGWLLGLSSHRLKRFYSDDPGGRGVVPRLVADQERVAVRS